MSKEPANQSLIVTHAVLIGLTPLVPVPFLDDVVKDYFQRRLVRKLADARGARVGDEDVRALADDPSSGCALGCLKTALFYPLKKVLRKIFIFLEFKRAVDLASSAFHRGYLLDYALREGLAGPPGTSAAVRAAIDTVIATAPIRPVEEAIRATFRQSKGALSSAAGLLRGALKGMSAKARPDDVAGVVEAVEDEEERRIGGVVAALRGRIEALPAEHFETLERRFRDALERPNVAR